MTLLHPGQPVRTGLYWVAGLYGLIVRLRLWCYRQGWFTTTRLPCCVVSVGNLTVGGTGKTPVVIFLTQRLLAQGRRVAILSRGYKRTSKVPYLLVSDGSRLLVDPSEAGDEPFLMAQRCPQAIVAVGADRVALGRWVLERYPVDCIVLDDGFQHRALHRDVDLVLLDATDAEGLDALLPAGRLREPLQELDRASAVMITRADSHHDVEAIHSRLRAVAFPYEDAIEAVFRPESFLAIVSGEQQSIAWGRTKTAWLVSGIGNSRSFRRLAESIEVKIVGETVFDDHHRYHDHEVGQIRAKLRVNRAEIVLTTEKDGGKLSPFLLPEDSWWMLRLGTEVTRGEDRLHRLIDGPPSDGIQRLDPHA
ncbi:MAG: hypothetical protein A4E19_08710 [Nitrospira sp. SG-bin1]|nr:MAG: hypothetical protein A4E19_08710 [Nitrospira sp. SG-bin1]